MSNNNTELPTKKNTRKRIEDAIVNKIKEGRVKELQGKAEALVKQRADAIEVVNGIETKLEELFSEYEDVLDKS